jgi:pimeloyl-ACP methyl ester carboxylesterase
MTSADQPMLQQTIPSFDGRLLNVFHTAVKPQLPDVMLVLPFGMRQGLARQFYSVLAPRFNLVTWESRFVLDLEADLLGEEIKASDHARDLLHVIEHFQRRRTPPYHQFNVVGYCSGAGVALMGAALRPQWIRRLALVSGEFVLPESLCRQSAFQRAVDLLLPAAAASKERARHLYENISAGRRAAPSEFDEFTSTPFSTGEHLHRYGLNYVAYRGVDFLEVASRVPQAAMVMVALGDQQVTEDSSRIVAKKLPCDPELTLVEGDHYELCRGNRDVIELLSEFLLRGHHTLNREQPCTPT